jgi:hypothetical protein
MIRRLFTGLVLGLVLGGGIAAALVKGVGMNPSFTEAGGALVAYMAALATGAVVGLVAGKPIWAKGAWIEALLKTFFGALLGAGGMFLLQRFVGMHVDLTAYHLGSGSVGNLAFLSLPAIATVLSVFFELDNTDAPAEPDKTQDKARRVATGKPAAAKLRAPASSAAAEALDEDEVAASKRAKK